MRGLRDWIVGRLGLKVGFGTSEKTVVDADGALYQGGTEITSTAAELNALDGITSTVAELNILDGVTATAAEINLIDGSVAGTAVASKALVLGATKNVDVLAVDATLTVGGIAVDSNSLAVAGLTATADELNLNDGSVAGTAVASKTLVLGADKDVDVLAIADLKLGAGAGTSVTSTAAELNLLDGVTATTGELNLVDNMPADVTFAAAAGAANVTEVTITVKDAADVAIAGVFNLDVWLSDAATGAGLTGTSASGTVQAKAANGTDLVVYSAKKAVRVQTLATGVYVLEITDTAKTGFYVSATLPSTGATKVSAQLVSGDYGV